MTSQLPSPDQTAKAAAFARGFFTFLESRKLRAAVLHGGTDGFERDLSDIDFVVEHRTFTQLPDLINAYCTQSGWLLCQVLRHETSAAYFVCSAADDPTCAVALDACSDYQRNGTMFLRAEELLGNRKPLPWGGYGLDESTELRYRFAKAAAKGKDATECAGEFASYPEDARAECAAWLQSHWNITLKSWEQADLGQALTELRQQSNSRPSLLQPGALQRILSRIMNPTGLVVVTGREHFDDASEHLERVFGHLYFRRFRKVARFRLAFYKDLVSSTLIVVPEIAFPWTKLISQDCHFYLDTERNTDTQLAAHLYARHFGRSVFRQLGK